MIQLKVSVETESSGAKKYVLSPENVSLGAVKSSSVETVSVEIPAEWDGLAVRLTFSPLGKSSVAVLLSGSGTLITGDVTAVAPLGSFGSGRMVVDATDGTKQYYSTGATYMCYAHPDAGSASPSYTPDEYQQFVAEIKADAAAAVSSEAAAKTSETNAKASESAAAGSAAQAASSATAALNSQNTAAESASAANTSATEAAASESSAAAKAAAASESANNSELSAQAAAGKATEAANSKSEAAASETAAAGSASAAATSATQAAGSAAAAAQSAQSAADELVAVNAAGDTQITNINAAGTTQVQAVNTAGDAKIAAINALDVYTKTAANARFAGALVATESGNPLTIYPDATSGALAAAKVQGLTTQAGTGTPSPTNIRPIYGVGRFDKKIVITGNENWILNSPGTSNSALLWLAPVNTIPYCPTGNGICNKFTFGTFGSFRKAECAVAAGAPSAGIGKGYIAFVPGKFPLTSDGLSQFIAYLKQQYATGTPVTVYYQSPSYATATQVYCGLSITDANGYHGYATGPMDPLYDGDTLDFVTGECKRTKGYIASYAGEALPGKWISDRDVYVAGATPTTGAQVVYELSTPTTETVAISAPITNAAGDVTVAAENTVAVTYNKSLIAAISQLQTAIAALGTT